MQATQLVWLRNDLRLDDNPALAQARAHGPIHVVFCSTPQQWREHHESPARLGLRAGLLNDLGSRLRRKGIAFTVLEAATFADLPALLSDFCARQQLQQLWFNRETPVHEQRRDDAVISACQARGIACRDLPADLLVSAPVLTQQHEPFKVFTPYYRRWLVLLANGPQAPLPEPAAQGDALPDTPFNPPWAGSFRDDLWPATEAAAHTRLLAFCQKKLHHYKELRDFPMLPATSTLSPYLALGVLGPRRCVEAIQINCAQTGHDWLSNDWLRELAWRDFYKQLMVHFPRLSMGKPFKPETDHVRWRNDAQAFAAWCEGRTGFPVVDAAMRQLNQTGWMHNRLRMVAASFLTKLLLTDWRWGEQYFMEQLIDGEFAANNGGWQWSASTGCDAAPYFRVFNPTTQSERFDKEGDFIRRFVPELAALSAKHIHNPSPAQRDQCGYPQPVVDYKPARETAINAFRDLPGG
jgi:deoxyribodipyrimidine photo-lyase